MKTKINKPALILLLLLFLSGCGREEITAESEVENEVESGEDASVEIASDDEAAIAIERENEESAPAETEEADSLYPLLAAPSSVENIDFVLVAEDSYCIFDGEKYGYITEDGEEITPCIYDIAYPFNDGLACVCQDGKYGYIDSQGEVAIPFEFDRATPFVEGLAYFSIGNDYGFMDKTGTQVFSFECDSVSSFQEGLAYFSIDGRYGYIDQNGQIVIEPVYDNAGYFKDGQATVKKDGKDVVINREGEEVKEQYESILLEQYDSILLAKGGNYVYIEKDEKYGLADKKGNVLFEPLYDDIKLLPGENLLLIRKDELYGVMDMQGEVRIPAVYAYIYYDSYEDGTEGGMLVLRDMDGNEESMDITDFTEKIPCEYAYIDWRSQDRAIVIQDRLYGLIDREGNLIEPVVYDTIRVFENGGVWMKKDKETRFYNSRGEVVEGIRFYDDVLQYGDCYLVERNGYYGFMNEEGEEVVPLVYLNVDSRNVHGCSGNIFILMDFKTYINNAIIKTGEPERYDVSEVLLQNEITPRIGLYQEFTKSGIISGRTLANESGRFSVSQKALYERGCKKTYKLYDFDNTEEPLLYFKAEPYHWVNYPESYSGFYAIRNNQLVEVLTAYMCDGTMGGEYVCLWYDRETSRVLPGKSGFTGEFGEHFSWKEVYDWKDGEITRIASFEWIERPVSSFEEEEIAHAEMVYDREDNPYTKESIEQAQKDKLTVTVYYVNGEQTTIEKYQEMSDRYQ